MKITPAIEKSFGKWYRFFKPFIESPEMDKLFSYIKQRAAITKICPESSKVFRCFLETDPGELKCIICGISPYHTVVDGVPVADGLALSCSQTGRMQPSLEQLYNAIEHEFTGGVGLDIDMIHNPDLLYLAKQGVLLYNVALTVEKDRACSMNAAWEPFNKYFWTQVINHRFRAIPIIFMGEQAHKSANYLAPMLHYPFLLKHLASASYNNTVWDSEGVFQTVNKILTQNNSCWIEWAQHKRTEEMRRELANSKKYEPETDNDLPF